MPVITPFDPWKSPLCMCPPKYSLSAYTGCSHACRYCYISSYIPRAFQCRAKKDFIHRLRRDVRRIDPKLHISIANSSDPYPPQEDRLKLTRQALQTLLGEGFKVQLITKSNIVVRDLDIIKRGNCSVSMSITTLNNHIARKLEPNAPLPNERLKAIKKLVNEGIPCSVRVDPIIPGINDEKLEGLVKGIANVGANHIVASTYKTKTDNFRRVVDTFPEHKERLTEYYWVKGERVGRAQYLSKNVRNEILSHLKEVVESYGITYATCREGLTKLHSAKTCDGSHLIPNRRSLPRKMLASFG